MKQLVCEMCGSTDLIKKDGVFECQSCGCKYSVEEAKKMMVEGTVEVQGTVKLDSSEELKNLYELARRAKKDRNWDNAAKYYEMITIKDPNNWEPAFYSVFSKATTCTVGEIHIAGNSIYNCVQSTFELINNTISDKSVQIQAYTEVTNQVVEIIKALNNLARKQFDKYTPQMRDMFKEKFFNNISPTVCTMYELGDKLDLFFGSDIEANKLSVIAWKQGIEFERSLIPYLNDSEFIRNNINKYVKKIRKYDSSFEVVVESYDILERHLKGEPLTKAELTSLGLDEEYIENYKPGQPLIKEKGCYVATAVYGSYDCPQVWTLRRYRDYTLAKTWYGRAFIRIYYAISPTLVKWFGHTGWFKKMWQGTLDRMVAKLQANGVESTPYEDKNW